MFTRICREIVDVAIYALYPESFCGVNLAIRKVFAFSDSGCGIVLSSQCLAAPSFSTVSRCGSLSGAL